MAEFANTAQANQIDINKDACSSDSGGSISEMD
jgi:hypothetical protein